MSDFVTLWTVACQAPASWDSPVKNTQARCHAILQGILPIQGSNLPLMSPGLAGGFFTTSSNWEALIPWYSSSKYFTTLFSSKIQLSPVFSHPLYIIVLPKILIHHRKMSEKPWINIVSFHIVFLFSLTLNVKTFYSFIFTIFCVTLFLRLYLHMHIQIFSLHGL